MTTAELIIGIFCTVDNQMRTVAKHPQAELYPSEVVTLALLYALKGGSKRAFYRWLTRDWQPFFPNLPHRTRLFRLFNTHRDWAERFYAQPTMLGVIDSYGIEFIHPIREGRSPQQIGKKGLSNHRWIVGGKVCLLVNQWGLIVGWDCATANVHDTTFQPLIRQVEEEMIVLGDNGFHAHQDDPVNLKICPPKQWNSRMVIETVYSMLTSICRFKHMTHRVWTYFQSHLAFAAAVFNMLVQWHGFKPDENGFYKLSMAEFSL